MPKKQIIAAEVATKMRSIAKWLRIAEEESSSAEGEVEVQKQTLLVLL